MKKNIVSICIYFLLLTYSFSAERFETVRTHYFPPADLKLFESCYPDVTFKKSYDNSVDDWKLELTTKISPQSEKTKSITLYWAKGRILPKDKLSEKDIYWTLLSEYDKELRDPKTYTQEEIETLRKYGSKESRMNTAGSPMFFFDWLYDAESAWKIEKHISKIKFLGKSTKVHERIVEPLKRAEKRILELKDSDKEVKSFIDTLTSADAYFWRQIANTTRKSFHSYGIAVDVLPKRLRGKQTYWSWAKAWYGDNWMLTPLSDRWSPPKKVVDIMESEGFIWGGKWGIWDTMHFEYHPEILKYNKIIE